MNRQPFHRAIASLALIGALATSSSASALPASAEAWSAEGYLPAPMISPLASPVPKRPPARPPARPSASGTVLATSAFGIEVSNRGQFAVAKGLGAQWVRRAGIWWPDVEPVEGQRNWEAMQRWEADFQAASEQGLEMIIIVRGTPDWAQARPGISCGAIKPDKYQAFARFVGELVRRYSRAPYNVRYWEIGNEPDIAPHLVDPASLWGCWGDAEDAYYGGGAYAAMLKKVYPAVKAANRNAQVLLGGLLLDCDPRQPPEGKDCRSANFLEGILRAGGGRYFDGVSFHAYDYYGGARGSYGHAGWRGSSSGSGPVGTIKAQFVRDVLRKYGAASKYLMNTEMGLVCGSDGLEPLCQTADFSDTKAAHVVQAYVATLTGGWRTGVWYNLTGWRASGLVDAQGKPAPAGVAYRVAAQALRGAASWRAISAGDGLKMVEFRRRDGGRVRIVWSTDGAEHELAPVSGATSAYDTFGTPLTAQALPPIGVLPVYIEVR